MSMMDEILEQPTVARRLLDENQEQLAETREMISGDITYAVIAARGTSDNAARYAQYVWGARNRISVALAAPSLFGPYSSPPDLHGAVVVGISQSGASPDLVEVLAYARRSGRPTAALTNVPDSALGRTADVVVDLSAGEERAVAATKTYTAELIAVAATSSMVGDGVNDEVARLPELLEDALDGIDGLDAAVDILAHADRCVVVGRGFHHSTAFEWALKLQELSYVLAQPFSTADFLHGPVAVVEGGFPVLMVATSGGLFAEMLQLVDDLRDRGASIVAITDQPGFPADRIITIPQAPEWLSPIVAAPALQRFAHQLTLARGLDPDSPRGLSKVTLTK